MKRLITKEEALEFKRRWEVVNEAERQELRETSTTQKLRQLAALMTSVKAFAGWAEALSLEEDEVRDRWHKLKEAYNVSK